MIAVVMLTVNRSGATSATQTTTSASRGTKEFKVVVGYGAASNVESPSAFIIWDEYDIVNEMVSALIRDVTASSSYTTAQTAFLSCVNQGRAVDDRYESLLGNRWFESLLDDRGSAYYSEQVLDKRYNSGGSGD